MNYIIDVETGDISKIADGLNELLANYQVYAQKIRAFQWKVRGNYFLELHHIFEEMYGSALLKTDEIAERILILGHDPVNTLARYLEIASVKEISRLDTEQKMIETIITDLNQILRLEKNCLEMAAKAGNNSTVEVMERYISSEEKQSWMLHTWLKA